MAEHNALTDPQLHEPKGCAAASANEVYVSNGAGSGVWTATSSLQSSTSGQSYVLNVEIDDVAGTNTHYIPVPMAGTITSVHTALENTIDVDTDIGIVSTVGSVGSITITASGSAAGDVDSLTSFVNDSVAVGNVIIVASAGSSTVSSRLWVSVTIERT